MNETHTIGTTGTARTERTRRYADDGYKYCYLLSIYGWRSVGMVPNDYQLPFLRGYFANTPRVDKIAFVPFCWFDNPNVMTQAEIEAYAHSIVTREVLNLSRRAA